MVHIGLSRWFVEILREPAGHGEVTLTILLRPEGRRYRVVETERMGSRINLVEKEVSAQTVNVRTTVEFYGLTVLRELECWRRLADEVASNAVNQCLSSGIVNYREYDKASGIYLARYEIVRAIIAGQSDVREELNCVDLTVEMSARETLTLNERIARLTVLAAGEAAHRQQDEELRRKRMDELADAQAKERARLEDPERMRLIEAANRDARLHQEERMRSEEEKQTAARDARYRSYDLLDSLLSPEERAGFKRTRVIRIKTGLGEFRLVEKTHGGVHRYVDGFYECSYCVVFADANLPLGDNLAMKVALLKTDPERLIRTANRYIDQSRG